MSQGPVHRSVSLAIPVICCALPSAARDLGLPVGLAPESSASAMFLTGLAWAVGLVLFLLGRRLPRFTVGAFFGIVGTAVALPLLSGISYWLCLALAFGALLVGLALYLVIPRLAMAVACSWVLPALYAAWLMDSGSFERKPLLALGLAVAGFLIGAVLPRMSLAFLGSALGVLLVSLARMEMAGFRLTAGAFAAGFVWQAFVLPRVWVDEPAWVDRKDVRKLQRGHLLTGGLGWGVLWLVLPFVVLAFAAPAPEPQDAVHRDRLAAVRAAGGLKAPAFLLSSADAFYLYGRPVPVCLASARPGWTSRALVLLLGRSSNQAIHAVRTVKGPDEIAKMKLAALATSRAFEDVAPLIRPGVNERAIEEAIVASFKRSGATALAFEPIVGSGTNATLPHYMANDAVMERGLVVIDIGAMVDGYGSDMTRTFSVNGRYTDAERRLFDVITAARAAAVARIKPGASWRDVDAASRDVIKKAGFGAFYTHGVGHHVGIEPHDVGGAILKENMTVTVEPGIYIPEGAAVDRAYWNLGIRIEDTYLVTRDGCEPLTSYPEVPPQRSPLDGGGVPAPPNTSPAPQP